MNFGIKIEWTLEKDMDFVVTMRAKASNIILTFQVQLSIRFLRVLNRFNVKRKYVVRNLIKYLCDVFY